MENKCKNLKKKLPFENRKITISTNHLGKVIGKMNIFGKILNLIFQKFVFFHDKESNSIFFIISCFVKENGVHMKHEA